MLRIILAAVAALFVTIPASAEEEDFPFPGVELTLPNAAKGDFFEWYDFCAYHADAAFGKDYSELERLNQSWNREGYSHLQKIRSLVLALGGTKDMSSCVLPIWRMKDGRELVDVLLLSREGPVLTWSGHTSVWTWSEMRTTNHGREPQDASVYFKLTSEVGGEIVEYGIGNNDTVVLAASGHVPTPTLRSEFENLSSRFTFDVYPASVTNLTKNAEPRLVRGTDFWNFRTRIRNAAAKTPNFAGHYILEQWGCGTECQMGVLIDARTGDLFWLPISGWGVLHRTDSNLLIVNPVPPHTGYIPGWLTIEYFVWTGTEFKLVHEEKPVS